MSSELGTVAADRCAVLIGRTLAACLQPVAAWRHPTRSFRVLVVLGYFTGGYLAGLAVAVFTR